MEKESVKVYIAQIPHDIEVGEVFPIERNAEIQSCKNEEKKKEKCVIQIKNVIYLKKDFNEEAYLRQKALQEERNDILLKASELE